MLQLFLGLLGLWEEKQTKVNSTSCRIFWLILSLAAFPIPRLPRPCPVWLWTCKDGTWISESSIIFSLATIWFLSISFHVRFFRLILLTFRLHFLTSLSILKSQKLLNPYETALSKLNKDIITMRWSYPSSEYSPENSSFSYLSTWQYPSSSECFFDSHHLLSLEVFIVDFLTAAWFLNSYL